MVGLTHRGSTRERNEDALLLGGRISQTDVGTPTRVVLPEAGGLVAVADGLGGRPAGDRASRAALLALSRWPLAELDGTRTTAQLTEQFTAALTEAGSAVRADSWGCEERRGMATTVAGLAFTTDGQAITFNVGDSRCYRSTRTGMEQVSTDDARSRTVLTQVIGGTAAPTGDVDAHLTAMPAEPGTRFLVCTDGLHGAVPDEVLAAVLRADRTLEQVVERLQLLALQLGTTDDLTLAVAEVVGER
ncbi:protein phosphatase [Quadrisphaera granulorum]|uniref:Protein phosphatase n=1 Tax=Quadrisphaera granulorum TaxID=317664 RepID=A0A316ACG1_9ACTN|nr:protein phosphatase [Quadrisphaera granulorum]SZE95618.1 protein phosphatase [Quadrisphaera granulorum]